MELHGEKREIKGTKVKTLRKKGIIPAVIFSKKSSLGKADVLDVQVDAKAFSKVFAQAGTSALIEFKLGNETKDVLVKDIQVDPITLSPIHVSLYEVDMSQPIETKIPVDLINEEECEPVKAKTGILIQVLDEIRIRTLPKNMPQHFEVDVSVLKEVEDSLTIADAIKVDPEKIEILTDLEEVLVKVDYAEQREVEEEETSVEGVEVITEAKEGEESSEDSAEETKSDESASE